MQEEYQNKKGGFQVWMPIALALALSGGLLIGLNLSKTPAIVIQQDQKSGKSLGSGKIEELIRYIEAKYVDPVDRENLMTEAIDKIIENLDPHSAYIPADELAKVNENLEGKFDGIGVEFLMLEDTMVIVSVLEKGPADQAGLLPGDRIVGVKDSVVAGKTIPSSEIVKQLRGVTGTAIEVSIFRKKTGEQFKKEIVRGKIPIKSVDTAYFLEDNIGYLKINRFSSTTTTRNLSKRLIS